MKTLTQSLKTIALALILALGVSYVSAWTAPTATPTDGNVASPLNTSANLQSKSGTLTLSKTGAVQGFETYGKTLFATVSGNVGIGTTNPSQKLTVAGIIESTSGGVKFPDGTTQTTAGQWPAGSYCILQAGGACPTGFTGSSLGLFVGSHAHDMCAVGARIAGDSKCTGSSPMATLTLMACCK